MHRRKQPPQPFKIMTDQELTFDQLQTIAGGPAFVKLGEIKVGRRSIVHPELLPQFIPGDGTTERYNPGKGASLLTEYVK